MAVAVCPLLYRVCHWYAAVVCTNAESRTGLSLKEFAVAVPIHIFSWTTTIDPAQLQWLLRNTCNSGQRIASGNVKME